MGSNKTKTFVIALGGNSILRAKEKGTADEQYKNLDHTAEQLLDLLRSGNRVVITHGNGPQVGNLLLADEAAKDVVPPMPLDVLGAQTEGFMGYMIQNTLANHLRRAGAPHNITTVITQVIVDKNDPAFENPSKPIGPFLDQETALKRRDEEGWDVIEDAGRGWRRVVPSPIPRRIIERDAIKNLSDAGFVVIAVGGGGIPVMEENGKLKGTAAVIDKDYASSLLALAIGVDLFLISTAVEKVALNFGRPNQEWLDRITLAEARQYLEEGHFAPGSMYPKIQAIVDFLERGGKEALVTNPENIERALAGETGTRVVP